MSEMLSRPISPMVTERHWLTRSKRASSQARRLVRKFLDRVDTGEDFAEKALLVASELVTNAITHGTIPGQLALLVLEADENHVWVSVQDPSAAVPQMRAETEGETGRGLFMVSRASEAWGWEPRDGIGKRLWTRLAPGPVG